MEGGKPDKKIATTLF